MPFNQVLGRCVFRLRPFGFRDVAWPSVCRHVTSSAGCRLIGPSDGVQQQANRRCLHTARSPLLAKPMPSDLSSFSKLVVSRMMGPDDVSMFSAVHGGSIMQIIEEAGTVLSTQYCNRIGTSLQEADHPLEEIVTVSGCVEKIDFLHPIFIGDLAEVHAEIGYTSQHSVQVLINVYAKNIAKARRKLAAQAKLWYVPLCKGDEDRVMEVPGRTYTRGNPHVQQEGLESYKRLKALRQQIRADMEGKGETPITPTVPSYDPVPGTVAYSTINMNIPIHPSSCWGGERYVRGGVIMKYMDECASLTATNHTAFYCFTANVDTIIFLRKATVGGVLAITCKPIFVSKKSMELKITVDEMQLIMGDRIHRYKTAEAIFTFISVDADRKLREITPLKLQTEDEIKLFEERKKLYEQRKAAAAAAASK